MRPPSRGIGHVSNNQSQNKAFRDATRGLNKAQRERVRREVEHRKRQYENLDFQGIVEIAEEVNQEADEK
jgi:hypothetical protein